MLPSFTWFTTQFTHSSRKMAGFGFTGFYWVFFRQLFTFLVLWLLFSYLFQLSKYCWTLLGFTGFYLTLGRFTGLYWIVTGFSSILLVLLRWYRNSPNLPSFYRVLLGFTGFHWVSLGFTGFYWVLLGFTWFYCILHPKKKPKKTNKQKQMGNPLPAAAEASPDGRRCSSRS